MDRAAHARARWQSRVVRARQNDSKHFRLWEVAGTAHADSYTAVAGSTDLGKSPDVVGIFAPTAPIPGVLECAQPVNSGPQHFVLKAAVAALEKWVRTGKAPKSAPRLDVDPGPPAAIRTDEHGNALGGIRTPQVDVPIATFTGVQPGSILCQLFGTTNVFSEEKLATLYPTRTSFLSRYKKALRRSVKAGWLLPPDAKLMLKWAKGSGIGG